EVVDAAERAEVTRRAFEWQRIHARFARHIAFGEARQRKATVMHERLPVAGIAEVDPNAARVRPHSRFDVAAVTPAAILDGTRREHDIRKRTQAVGMSESVQRQLRRWAAACA